jgi:hypothetical protein
LTAIVNAVDKVYDGNALSTATLSIVSGLANAETVNATGTAAFNSKDVATANLVTVSGTALADGTNGGLASNYTIASSQMAVAHITPKLLTVAGQAAQDKEYDGTTMATLTGGSLDGLLTGETVELHEAGTFATADAGTAIAVTAANSLGGTAAANYSVLQPVGLVANITAAPGPEVPEIPEVPGSPETPQIPETPQSPGTPETPEVPPASATDSVAYQSAVSHAVLAAQVAPAGSSAALLSDPTPDAAPSIQGPGGSVTYDIADLNLTVVAQDIAALPSEESSGAQDDEK